MLCEIARAGHRALAIKLHPDTGGEHEVMVLLNRAREWIEALATS